MQTTSTRRLSLLVPLVVVPLALPSALAQSTLSPHTIAAGAGTSSGVSFQLSMTFGQHDAGTLSGNRFSIRGGYLGSGRNTPRCPADFDDGSGTGSPDGGVTIEDLLYYLALFEQGVRAADVDDGSGTGTRDGGVTIEDLLYFLTRYQAGC